MAKRKELTNFENFIQLMDIAVRIPGGAPIESIVADLGTTRTQVLRYIRKAKLKLNITIDPVFAGTAITHIMPRKADTETLEAMALSIEASNHRSFTGA